MSAVSIIGCGFVADLYMRSLATFPDIRVVGVFDHDAARLAVFCDHWDVPAVASLDALLAAHPRDGVVLNLTNPSAHHQINMACLNAGCHVYSEKPLAVDMADAVAVRDAAAQAGLQVASAPCSVLGEAAQTMGRALRQGVVGTPRLIYAELDDGFIPQAAYRKWLSETGAPWPFVDEFNVGCTLEHAGYYLSWLISWFGPVRTVVAASASVVPDKPGGMDTPDVSVATLFFENGPVTRLTCSIVAPHDHQIRIVGDSGVLGTKQAWNNDAKVTFKRRMTVRRRLLEHPVGRRIRIGGDTHPKVGRWGAAAMNFALGPADMLDAIDQGRPARLAGDFALHLNEVTLAIQNAGEHTGSQTMTTTCQPMEPMPWAM